MMHVDGLQRYWHKNKEQTLAADSIFSCLLADHPDHVPSVSFFISTRLPRSFSLLCRSIKVWGVHSPLVIKVGPVSYCIYCTTKVGPSFPKYHLGSVHDSHSKQNIFSLAQKGLKVKPAQCATTGSEYNKLEGDRKEKRWHAYRKGEASRITNELYL